MNKKLYHSDDMPALDALLEAQKIAFGPVVFQVARLMKKFGVLAALLKAENGLTLAQLCAETHKREYVLQVLLEASLSARIVYLNDDRYRITKTGVFLLNDQMTSVNMNFVHDICYEGMFDLEETMETGKPVGLKRLGDFETVYQGLSRLSDAQQSSWFEFDHFYSDGAFKAALEIMAELQPARLLDVGGNTGRFAMECVKRNPETMVTVFDLPQQVALLKKNTASHPEGHRIKAVAGDLRRQETVIPQGFDVIWMSQFLDCFSKDEVRSILDRAKAAMGPNTVLFILELFWDRQKYEAAAYCLNQTSPYFTAIANGNSKFYSHADFTKMVKDAGLTITQTTDQLGLGHTLLQIKS